jgi:putative protease
MEEEIGFVEHFFTHVGVAAISITNGKIKVGDTIHIKGATTDFQQTIDSMEIDRQKIEEAGVGSSVGIKVQNRVRENDSVYVIRD